MDIKIQVAILGVKTKMSKMKYRLNGINEGKINKIKHTEIENIPNKIQIDKKIKKWPSINLIRVL